MKIVLGLFFTAVLWAILLIPFWIFLAFRGVASPQGFWQEFAMGLAGIWILGGVQLVAGFAGIFLTLGLWGMIADDSSRYRKPLRRV